MLAYWHRMFSGFVPCRAVARYVDSDGCKRVILRTTAERPNYPRGWLEHAFAYDVCQRPLRVSRQHLGRLYTPAITEEQYEALPVSSAYDKQWRPA